MNKTLVTIVALSVDTRHAVLYLHDGNTMTLAQGDARLPKIVAEAKDQLSHGPVALVDVTPVVVQRTEFGAAEKGTGGVIKFFRVAKSFLKKLVNTESPEAVPEEVAHVSPLSIGVFPGVSKEVINPGTKEKDEAPQEAVPDLTQAEADAAVAERLAIAEEVVRQKEEGKAGAEKEAALQAAVQNATTDQKPAAPTNAEKLAAAKERLHAIVGNSVGTERAEFHTPLDESKETIVAVHTETGAIVPDAHKLARHLRQSEKLQNYAGFQKFIERLSAIIDQRGHSVEDLMKFIEHGDLPIADDGSIVIYKKLNRHGPGVFTDVHTGKIKQKVGAYVYLLPHLVDPNRRNSCSNGLHVGVMSYVRSFSGNVTIMAKLRPEDVFAVPEYEHTKMRVAGYHIVAELPDRLRSLVDQGVSISVDPDGAKLLHAVLRGEHIGITQLVEVGGHRGTNVTYTDTGVGEETQPATLGYAQALDMDEKLEAELPTAPEVKAQDLVQPHGKDSIDEDEDMSCDQCGADTSDGEGFDGLCGSCADKATAPDEADGARDAKDESSLNSIMSNDPKETSGEVAPEEAKTAPKLSQKEQAQLLYDAMKSAMDKTACHEAAQRLVDFRKSARKGFAALGLPDSAADEVLDAMGVTALPVNAPKPAKAQSTPVAASGKLTESTVANVMAALEEGLSQRAVAQKFGLSKDQVYRLSKKKAA